MYLFILLYVPEYFAYVHVCVPMYKPVEALDGCELWCGYRELNLGLCESNSTFNCWGVSPAQELFMGNYYS